MTPTRRVVPGTWYAVLGSGAVVLLPPQEKARVPAVWALVDDGAGFDEVLDALIADGLRDLSAFALVSVTDGDARIVLRGGVSAELHGRDGLARVSGATAATWFEREVRQVNGFRLVVDAEWTDEDRQEWTEDDDHAYRLGDGIARAAGVDELAVVDPGITQAAEPPPRPTEPAPEPAPAPVPPPVAVPDDELATEAMPLLAREEPARGPAALIRVPGGETIEVTGTVLLGRHPDPARAGGAGEPRLVTVESPSREVSSTHLEVRPGDGADEGHVVATDLGSTNGTVVAWPDRPREELRSGVPVRLVPGAVLDLGDGASVEVVAP